MTSVSSATSSIKVHRGTNFVKGFYIKLSGYSALCHAPYTLNLSKHIYVSLYTTRVTDSPPPRQRLA